MSPAPIFLRWGGKTIRVAHEDVVGFVIHEDVNLVGQKSLNVGLMRRDGVLVRSHEWHRYGAEVMP